MFHTSKPSGAHLTAPLPRCPPAANQLANDTYNRIKVLARLDAEKWHTGIDPHRGLMQITREFIPTRLKQLTECGGA